LTVGGSYYNVMTISRFKWGWIALVGSTPFNGDIGEICEAEECKVEFCCTKEVLKNTITTIKKVHPYEIPVINIIPILNSFEF
ncbi:divalent cation tolerance protein CutA, partial [Clostridium botulinum]|nr:divalent cation tolerance protein CutA [Clostridium botulinum]